MTPLGCGRVTVLHLPNDVPVGPAGRLADAEPDGRLRRLIVQPVEHHRGRFACEPSMAPATLASARLLIR